MAQYQHQARLITSLLKVTLPTPAYDGSHFHLVSSLRIGSKYLKPGYGFGGPCFPRDNRALAGHAQAVGVDAMIPLSTDRYNKYHTKLMAEEMKAQNNDTYVY
jgi:hypothetical protein